MSHGSHLAAWSGMPCRLRYRNHERLDPMSVSNRNISRAINFTKTTERLDKVKFDSSLAGKHRVNNAFTVFSKATIRTFFYEQSQSGYERTQKALSGHVSNVSNQTSNVENSHQNQRPGLPTSEDEHSHVRNIANDTNHTKPEFMLRTFDSKPNIRATTAKPETKHSCNEFQNRLVNRGKLRL